MSIDAYVCVHLVSFLAIINYNYYPDLGYVADLVNLQGLNLAYNDISDAGMVHLKGISSIKLHIPIEA